MHERVHIKTITLCGLPIRVDATLCDEDEIWLEGPHGQAVCVWPPPVDAHIVFTDEDKES